MKQIWITAPGPPEVLKLKEVSIPEPGENDVLIKVRYAGINFADIMARLGIYPDAPKLPAVVGYEVSGVVEKVGKKVDQDLIGKEVFALTRFGGYSEYVLQKSWRVFELPENMTLKEAAAMPVNYLTAYQLLIVMGSLREKNRVLIHNAGGGVGLAAIDLCKIYNAKIFGTASSGKHTFLKKRGVDELIDYRTQDFVREILSRTNGEGVDIVIDPLGGSWVKKDLQVLRPSGRVMLFGISSSAKGKTRSLPGLVSAVLGFPLFKTHPVNLMNKNIGICGVNLGHLWGHEAMVREWAQNLLEYYREGKISPYVDKVFSFEDAARAHHYIQDRKNKGKVLLSPSSGEEE